MDSLQCVDYFADRPSRWIQTALGEVTALFLGLTTLVSTASAQLFTDVSDDLRPTGLIQSDIPPNPDCTLPTECQIWFTGGASVADYDNDGDPDIFYTRYGEGDVLFENQGDGTFINVAQFVGLDGPAFSNGSCFVDIDNDGDSDLIVSRGLQGHHALYVNHRTSGTGGARPLFVDLSQTHGFTVGSTSQRVAAGGSVVAGDYDRDGWADVYVTEWAGPLSSCSDGNSRLWRNLGAAAPGHLEDTTSPAGVTVASAVQPASWTFAASFRDLDGDGLQDIALVGDFGTSRLFWNLGDGTFADGTSTSGVGRERSGMGSSFADVDRDGDFDWFVSAIHSPAGSVHCPACNIEWDGNMLYRNDGDRAFAEVGDAAGLRDADWAWGAVWFDADNDGDHDLFVLNGIQRGTLTTTPNRYFEQVASLQFSERGSSVGLNDTGQGRGVVTLDFDLDGDLDLFVVRNGDTPLLLRNDGGSALGDWIQVAVSGRTGTRDGLGALVRVTPSAPGGRTLLEGIDSTADYLGQSERFAHFGLGPGFEASGHRLDVEVLFPSGHVVAMEQVVPNQRLTVVEPQGAAPLAAVTYQPSDCAIGASECVSDCNGNELDDSCEITNYPGVDCDRNGVVDSCEIALGLGGDCNANGQLDVCELAFPQGDSDLDGVLDDCEPTSTDAGVLDAAMVDCGRHGCDAPPTTTGCQAAVKPGDIKAPGLALFLLVLLACARPRYSARSPHSVRRSHRLCPANFWCALGVDGVQEAGTVVGPRPPLAFPSTLLRAERSPKSVRGGPSPEARCGGIAGESTPPELPATSICRRSFATVWK